MNSWRYSLAAFLLIVALSGLLLGQQPTQSSAVVPRLLNYSGKAVDAQGKAISGIAGVMFSATVQEKLAADHLDGFGLQQQHESCCFAELSLASQIRTTSSGFHSGWRYCSMWAQSSGTLTETGLKLSNIPDQMFQKLGRHLVEGILSLIHI